MPNLRDPLPDDFLPREKKPGKLPAVARKDPKDPSAPYESQIANTGTKVESIQLQTRVGRRGVSWGAALALMLISVAIGFWGSLRFSDQWAAAFRTQSDQEKRELSDKLVKASAKVADLTTKRDEQKRRADVAEASLNQTSGELAKLQKEYNKLSKIIQTSDGEGTQAAEKRDEYLRAIKDAQDRIDRHWREQHKGEKPIKILD